MSETVCANCLKLKFADSGSITQWLNVCNCDRMTSIQASADDTQRCQSCGLSSSVRRPGSFTQWIFQADCCCCEFPTLPSTLKETADSYKSAVFRGFDIDESPSLEVDSEKFPLDRYKPIEIIGGGASGTVYRGVDRLLYKCVAIKVLRRFDRDALISFQNEARTTSKLSHPNIVKVLDLVAPLVEFRLW
ncbi:MAG: protein kinase [Candidatus Obscuribacterales bacterium]|nr:protein kinase [Candidatus Obscuribacterales bacterium]